MREVSLVNHSTQRPETKGNTVIREWHRYRGRLYVDACSTRRCSIGAHKWRLLAWKHLGWRPTQPPHRCDLRELWRNQDKFRTINHRGSTYLDTSLLLPAYPICAVFPLIPYISCLSNGR
jgi:hypothetical protein